MPNCQNDGIGIPTLIDQGATLYKGVFSGGLWGGGSSARPKIHTRAGHTLARAMPRPAALAMIGASSCDHLLDELIPVLQADPLIQSDFRPIRCSKPGKDMTDLADPDNNYWSVYLPALLAASDITAEEITAAWYFTRTTVTPTETFPTHVYTNRDRWVEILKNTKAHLPNVTMAYLCGLHWFDYATAAPAPEPYWHEQSFAIQDLVTRQARRIDAALGWDISIGLAPIPWVTWGGYVWSDGATPRSDGLALYCPADVLPDGGHPSPAGALKLSQSILLSLKQDPTTRPWMFRPVRSTVK